MSNYLFLIFLHVLGAVGIFAAWGIESTILRQLRQTRAIDEAKRSVHLLGKQRVIGPISMLIVLATGIWMGVVRWGHQDWMVTAFAGMILIIVIGVILARRTMPGLKTALAGEPDGLPSDFATLTTPLAVSLQLRASIGVGIVGLMTMKPGLGGSLAILGIAIGTGIIMAIRSALRKASFTEREAPT